MAITVTLPAREGVSITDIETAEAAAIAAVEAQEALSIAAVAAAPATVIDAAEAASLAAIEAAEDAIITPTTGTLAVAEAAAILAVSDEGGTQVAAVAAEGGDQIALILATPGFDTLYPNAYATALPREVSGYTSLVAGSGGTNGTFALGVTGGSITGVEGTFSVSGGALTAITITNGGLGSGTTPPTLGFTASSGLTGASATAVVSPKVATTGRYLALSSDGLSLQLYQNDGTSTPAIVAGVSLPTTATTDALDAFNDRLTTYIVEDVASINMYDPATMRVPGYYVASNNTIAPDALWGYIKVPVTAGDVVAWKTNTTRRTGSTWLDVSSVPIAAQYAATDGVAGTSYTRTAPAGAAFLALNLYSNSIAEPTQTMVNLGDTALTYQAYLVTLALQTEALPVGLQTLREELDADILIDVLADNLYNTADRVTGSYITGAGAIAADASWGMVFISMLDPLGVRYENVTINANTTRRAGSAFYTAKNTGGLIAGTYSSSSATPEIRDVHASALWLGVNLYSNTITEPTEFMVSSTAGPITYSAYAAPTLGIRAEAVATATVTGPRLVLNGLTGTAYIETERGDYAIRRGVDPFPNGSSNSKKTFNFVSDAIDGAVLRTMDDDVAPVRLVGPGTVGANHDYVVNRTIRCIVDNLELATRTGTFSYKQSVAFLETYDIDIGGGVLCSIKNGYVFDADANCTIYTGFVARASITLQDLMFLQAVVSLSGVDGDVNYYIPQTLPITHESTSRNYALIDTTDTTGWTTGLLLTPARCEPTGLTPDRIVMLTDTFGFAQGYTQVHSADPSVRAALTTTKRGEIRNGTKKWYPSAVDKGSLAMVAGDSFSIIGYRNLIVRGATRTCFYPVRANALDHLYIDWHDSDEVDTLPIPSDFLGRGFTVLHSRNADLFDQTVLEPGMLCNVTAGGDYGSLILQVLRS